VECSELREYLHYRYVQGLFSSAEPSGWRSQGEDRHIIMGEKPGFCWNCDQEVTVHVDEAAGDVHCTACEGSCVEVREPEQAIHHGVMCDRSGTRSSAATNHMSTVAVLFCQG
jgi:hypothetical protein